LQHFGPQPQLALIFLDGGEQLGVEHDPARERDVVVHPFGVYLAFPLAEHHVPLQIHLEGHVSADF
jgi:hypothetical protein